MEQISTKVASLMSGVSKRISALKESLSNLGTKLTNADQLLKSLKEWLHKLTHSDAPKARPTRPTRRGRRQTRQTRTRAIRRTTTARLWTTTGSRTLTPAIRART